MAVAIAIGQNAGTLASENSEDLTDGFFGMLFPLIAGLGLLAGLGLSQTPEPQELLNHRNIGTTRLENGGAGMFEVEHLAALRIDSRHYMPGGAIFSHRIHRLKDQQDSMAVGCVEKLLL
jgi:hypothetical protein